MAAPNEFGGGAANRQLKGWGVASTPVLRGVSDTMYIFEILREKNAEIVTIASFESVQAASAKFREKDCGAIVVRDPDGRLSGMITERDIVFAIADHGVTALAYSIKEIMNQEVQTCRASASVKDVMEIMARRKVRFVPVVEDGELLGVISSKDIVRCRLEERSNEAAVLRDVAIMTKSPNGNRVGL